MNRRGFLIGSSVTGISLLTAAQLGLTEAIAQIPATVRASGPRAVLSPLLPPNLEHMLYVRYAPFVSGAEPYLQRLSIEIHRTDADQRHLVGSIEEAEDRYFASLDRPTRHYVEARGEEGFRAYRTQEGAPAMSLHDRNPLDWGLRTGVSNAVGLAVMIASASNRIANLTRRGAGNRVYAHPRAFDTISAGPDRFADPIGRWTRYNSDEFYSGNFQFWANSRLPRNRVYVSYYGNYTDAPGGLAYDDHGRLTYLERTRSPRTFGNGADYTIAFDVDWAEDAEKVAA